MEELLTTEELVKITLLTSPETRGNDLLLYLTICKKISPRIAYMPYEKVMLESRLMGLPNYESVTRARRKLQARNKELRATHEQTNYRYKRWKVFREYATE